MKLCYMATTPEVKGPMPLAWLAPIEETAPAIAELGYTGIELQTRDPSQFDHDTVRRAIDDAGLELVALSTGPLPREDGLTIVMKDEDGRRRAIERYKTIVDLADEWGVDSSIGGFRGYARTAPSRQQGLEWFRAALDEIAEYADKKGRRIVLKPQCRLNTDFLMTMQETVDLIESMGGRNLVLEADMFHMALEEPSIVAGLVRARKYLVHVQLGDSNRLAPGQGFLPWRDIIETLRALGYDDWLSMEFTQAPDSRTAARQAIEFVRPLVEW
ncbi:MAG: sugar phosphate isomerase/epimerase [Chloroflexi bacterium]|nr:sugar phosphate isomerase/epimerase [Chloroflexota bacterium]